LRQFVSPALCAVTAIRLSQGLFHAVSHQLTDRVVRAA
jgi:hypothetical protein